MSGMFGEIGRDARRVRLAEGQRAGTGFHQQAVGMAVQPSNLMILSRPLKPRAANGAHGGFGTGVHHPHHIHGRHQLGHQGRHFHFHFGRRAKAQPRDAASITALRIAWLWPSTIGPEEPT